MEFSRGKDEKLIIHFRNYYIVSIKDELVETGSEHKFSNERKIHVVLDELGMMNINLVTLALQN